MKWTLLALLLVASSAFAEQPWPRQVVPANFLEVSTSTLPAALRDAFLNIAEFTLDGDSLADTYQICRIDLNGDGTDEFIVMSPQSYSGGPQMYVLQRRQHKFVLIATPAGRIYFAPRMNGYLQIVSQSRGGAGFSMRSLERYQRGRYHLVRLTEYRLREFGGEFDFVQELDPKPYDH